MKEKTGIVINDKYTIGKMIGRDGVHEVYFGVQRIADGIERDVAIKLLHNWAAIEERDRPFRIEEIATCAEIGSHPFIATVCDCGVDAELGPWLALEMASGALESFIGSEPAQPALVRNVADNVLRALAFVHEREKPIIHNNIKPRSILQLTPESWVLGNFNLASDFGSEKTLSEVTVKYASPEVLDVDLGEVGAASDLYSLGLCLYELALGTKRFQACFPSVYGSSSGSKASGSSENDKWIYWHVSPQLALPPLKEQLPNFPEDLSDAIEKMLRKPLEERASSARILAENIAGGTASAGGSFEQPKELEPENREDTAKLLLAIIGLVLVAAVAVFGIYGLMSGTAIPTLTMQKKTYETRERFVQITGTVTDMEPGSSLVITAGKDLLRSRTEATIDSDTGAFSTQLEMPVLGEYEGLCGVLNPRGDVVATTLFTVVRYPPETVKVAFVTRPASFGADIQVLQLVTGKEKGDLVAAKRIKTTTDGKGQCSLTIPYGPFDVQVKHPRYRAYKRRFETEIKRTQPIVLRLVYLPDSVIAAKRQALLDEYEDLKARAAAGDPEAIRRMAEIQKELAQLNDGGDETLDSETDAATLAKKKAIQDERNALLKEAADLAARAAAGDPEAIKRLQEINKRLEALNKEEEALTKKKGPPTATELDALAKKRAELAARAAAGDPEAIAALKKLDAELRARGIDPNNITGSKTPSDEELDELAKRRAELVARAAAGDPEAIAALKKLDAELRAKGIDPNNIAASKKGKKLTAAEKRAAIEKRMKELAARVAAGDPEAIAEMNRLKKQLQAVKEEEKAEARAKERQKIIDKMNALRARAAAGDPDAIAQLAKLQKKLDAIDAEEAQGSAAEQRKALIKKIQDLKARAAAGDPEAIRELKELERKSEILKMLAEGKITPEEADRLLRKAQKLNALDNMTIMAMDLPTLRQYVLNDLPRGALTVTVDAVIDKLHVRGVVLDQEELVRVMMRLAPAEKRLLLDVRVDPETIIDKLVVALKAHSIASATVHPFVIGPRHSLFVGLPADASEKMLAATRLIVQDFVAARDRATVKTVPKPVPLVEEGQHEQE